MSRRTYTNRSIAAAKLCVALVGMAAIPTWALAQQSTAKTEPTKAADAKPPLAIDFGFTVAADKSSAERELEALKAEMDSLNARLKQLQAEKTKQQADQKAVLQRAREEAKIAEDRIREVQQAEQKAKLLQAKQQADISEYQIREAKRAELKALEALKERDFAIADQQKEGVKLEGLKLQLGEFKVQTQQAIEKEKVAADAAANVAKTLKDLKFAQIAPSAAAPAQANNRQILRSGSQGVKVIGADGKEIPGVVVIIDKQVEVAAPQAKVINAVPGQAVNGEQRLMFLLQDHQGTIQVNPGAAPTQKTVEGKPLPAATNKTIQIVPASPAPPAAPAAPAAPVKVEGVRILMQPGAAPAVPPQPAKPKSDVTWTFDTVNLHSPAANTITLSRATYKLPKDQAATLATLLGGLKHIVMETKVDNDTLVVTTTPEAQKEIAGFVRLITGAVMKVNFSVPLSAATPALPALPTAQAEPAIPGTVVGEFKAADTKNFYAVVSDEALLENVHKYQIQKGKNGEMTIVGNAEKPNTDKSKIYLRAVDKDGKLTVTMVDMDQDGKLDIANVDAAKAKPHAVLIENGAVETYMIDVADTAKSNAKKIDVKATDVKGVTTIETTVDLTDAKPKVLYIKKGEKGESIILEAPEGQGETKGTIRLNGLSTVAPATPLKVVAPTAPAAPIQIKVVAPTEEPKKPVPAEAPKKAAPATPTEKSK